MVKVRALVVSCLVALLFAGTAAAQSWTDEIKFTKAPQDWEQYKKMKEEGAWLAKAFADPVATLKDDPDRFLTELGKNPYALTELKALNDSALRQELATVIVQKAEYDPIFAAVLEIAKVPAADRYLATAEATLLVDAVEAYVKDYPRIADSSREILLSDLANGPAEVQYVAIGALALVKNAPGDKKVTDALVAQLSSKNQAFIEAAAMALGDLGDTSAVKPLMEAFIGIPDDQDPMITADEPSAGPPVNEARLQIAIAVGKLTGIDRKLAELSGARKSTLTGKYEDLLKWWNENKGNYQ